MRPRRALLVAVAATALTATACGSSGGGSASTSGAKVTVAAFNFPESEILAQVYAQALQKNGVDASVKSLTTRPSVIPALQSGDVQVVPEYVGSFTEYFNKKENGANAKAVASSDLDATLAGAKKFATPAGLTVLTPSPAQDQNAFVVTKKFSDDNKITKLSQLAGFTGKLVLGGTPECKTYSLCQPGLEKTYGITFTGFEQTDLGGALSISKLKSGKVTLGEYLSSDGSVKANDFVVLEDDKHLQNVDNVTPVVNTKANTTTIDEVLNKVSSTMTTEDLIGLNAAVSQDRKLPKAAAQQWLKDKGLI